MAKIEIKYITKGVSLLVDKKDRRPNEANEKLWELRGIDLKVNDGEAIGLIGDNGSGKDILLKIIGGKDKQTTGFITTKNKITYVALDTLDESKTGLENIRQAITNAKVDNFKGDHLTNGIIDFSEIGEWIYRPVSDYSAGMTARLAVSIALFIEPELVLLDEVLSPLDRNFYFKVVQKIQELKDAGISFMIAEVRPVIIETLCEQTAWLQFGLLQDFGATTEVVRQYEYACDWFSNLSLPEKNEYLAEKQRDQVRFDVNKIYEVFKSEQFKHGYTRKDEPRMRKAFFVDRGDDPVSLGKEKETVPEKKKKGPLLTVILLVLVLLLGGAYWYQSEKQQTLSQADKVSSSQAKASSAAKVSNSISQSKALSAKEASESQAASKSISESQAAESAKKASEASESQASEKSKQASESAKKASSESQAKLDSERANTQTINVADGDTLESLAAKYATTVEKIQELNNLGSSTELTAGETLYVPK